MSNATSNEQNPRIESKSRPHLTRGRRNAVWALQWLLAVTFVGTGIWKLVTPIDALAAMIPWAGQVSPAFLFTTAAFDLLGGLGILLPTLTGILPALAPLAALGCAALQVSAIVFHVNRGEVSNTPFNVLMVALSLYVAWSRRRP